MVIINLKKYYPDIYENDTFIEVPDDVAEFLESERPKQASEIRKRYRYKAQYSLDAGDGIENKVIILAYKEAERDEQMYELLEKAMYHALTNIQYRRIHMRFVERKSYSEIAAEENVAVSTVASSVKSAIEKIRKYICKHSVN